MNISHFHAAKGAEEERRDGRRERFSILHRAADMPCYCSLPLSRFLTPAVHYIFPMIREAFVVPIRAFHHYVSSIASRARREKERRNMLVKLQSLERYVGHENGTHPPPPNPPLTDGSTESYYTRNICIIIIYDTYDVLSIY